MALIKKDQMYMQMAIEEAKKAEALGEVPIGAIIVLDGEVIARAHNLRETTQNATTHAELSAIQDACLELDSWRRKRQLYMSHLNLVLCVQALFYNHVFHVSFTGRVIQKGGAVHSLYELLNDSRFNHECDVTEGVLAEECGAILTAFFKAIRARKKRLKKEATPKVE